jgi:ABC-type multidrug transport system permease subunit
VILRFIWASARKDALRARRDPFAILIWIGIPLILGALITAVFGRGQVTPQGRLLVVDEDDSFVSNVLTGAFSREPMSKMVLIEKVSRAEGRERIDRGDASALLIIPKGLADAALGNEPYRLELLTNPSQRIMPSLIKEVLSVTVEAGFYLHQVAGPELLAIGQQNRDGIPTDVEIAQYSVAFNHVADGLRKYLFPPLIELETTVAKENTSGKSLGAVLYPTFIFMAVLFTSSALAGDIWKERNAGALRRLCTTRTPLPAYLAGKLLFVVLIFAAVGLMGVAVARWLAGVPVAYFAGAVLWLVFSGSCFFLLLLLLVLQASTQRGANTLSNLVVFPMAMLGGCFFPFDQMPAWMVRIGSKTPNGWAVIQFNALMDGSVNREKLALAAAGLLLAAGVAFVLALRKLPRFAL